MSESTLSFNSSSSFRNSLMNRNLRPYNITGVFTPPSGPINYETVLTDSEVIDSPNDLISRNPFANRLYPLNEYGPNGGFNLDITFNGPPLPQQSNSGEYDPNETQMDLLNEFFIDAAYVENRYGPIGGFSDMIIIDNIQNNNKIYVPYWDPPTFIPSTYTPYEIYLSDNPAGSSGLLSQDSYLAKVGAQTLKFLLQERVNSRVIQNSIGAVNLDALQDPFEASLVASGKEPLIYKDYRITVPENPIARGGEFLTRLTGAYLPFSLIPGDYFNEVETSGGSSRQTSSALNVTNQLTGGFLGPILDKQRTPSQTFLANTGNGQRSVLFTSVSYNRYQPNFDKNFGGLLGAVQTGVNISLNGINPNNGTTVGGYYVGSRTSEPSTITSPPNQVPVNAFGKQESSPVYGPSELGILYEGNQNKLNFGLGGNSYSDTGLVDGQFVWVSPKYKNNAGYKATVGGGTGKLDTEFNIISSSYLANQSTNIDFKDTSILDQTQRLIESADNVAGITRLKHVGNAINQVSKVFNDGYKEMTKGSKVVSYTNDTTGEQAGIEYCRVFTKDTPYFTYNDLQKTDGITTEGRRFSYSILDKTYNLNIAPLRNPGSTNIQPDAKGNLVAKKYMFSIENLAWRTSSRPGYTYDDLPVCEKGPNGGRVMWFPPYNLSFNDSSSPSFQATNFLGRPEPIYTYNNTSRSGTLSWTIIVDHPSVMNIIIEKQLKGKNKERIDSIINSFFAGCVKYDIYTLAKKFNTIPVSDLFTYQEIINNPRLTKEELEGVINELPKETLPSTGKNPENTGNGSGNNQNANNTEAKEDPRIKEFQDKYSQLAFYFHNDEPKPQSGQVSNESYDQTYVKYEQLLPTYNYQANSLFDPNSAFCKKTGNFVTTVNNTGSFDTGKSYQEYCSQAKNVNDFFTTVVKSNYDLFNKDFITEAYAIIQDGGTITIDMVGSASALSSFDYNKNLSLRRTDSVIQLFKKVKVGDANLNDAIANKKFIINKPEGKGEEITLPKAAGGNTFGFEVNCTYDVNGGSGSYTDKTNAQIYSVNAMSCRRVKIANIKVTIPPKEEVKKEKNKEEEKKEVVKVKNPVPRVQPTVDVTKKIKEGIAKKILRNLLSECDYFEVVKEQNPMVYDSIKEKIKYFNPSFHSITPEGLNARLTFLNQCVRPGETIPIIGTDGKPKYNDAINTAFGAPPILVLRIGDFYHTKIVPTSLGFTYDNNLLDLNPEGIGVQPMMVKVSMNFNIIGGMGLAKPVEQLQNALSFNYYANTEIYDERATWTEDTSALDKEVVDAIINNQPPVKVNNVANQQTNDGGTTIGNIITNIPVPSGQTGEISYQTIMDKLLSETVAYFNLIVNKLESLNKAYNYGVVQMVNFNRQYNEGEILSTVPQNIEIFGKPNMSETNVALQTLIDNQFNGVIDDINNNSNPIILNLKNFFPNNSYDDKPLRDVKTNLINYIKSIQANFSSGIMNIVQEMVIFQQNYVQIIRKLNVVAQLTDGKILDTGLPRIYNISGTTQVSPSSKTVTGTLPINTLDELFTDYDRLKFVTDKFNKLLTDKQIAFGAGGYEDDGNFRLINTNDFATTQVGDRVPAESLFLILARIITDKNKKDELINSVIKGDLLNVKPPKSSANLRNKFEKVINDLEVIYKKELKAEEKLFEDLKKNPDFKQLTEGIEQSMYPKGKTRKFNYSTIPSANNQNQIQFIKKLYETVNQEPNNKKTFNGKIKFD